MPQYRQTRSIEQYCSRSQRRIANELANQNSTNSEDSSTESVRKLKSTMIIKTMIKYSTNDKVCFKV